MRKQLQRLSFAYSRLLNALLQDAFSQGAPRESLGPFSLTINKLPLANYT